MAQNNASITQSTETWELGVGACYGNGWRKMRKYFLELLAIVIIAMVIGLPSGMGSWVERATSGAAILGLFGFIYSVLVVWPVGYGVSFAYLKAARSDRLEVKNMFAAFGNYWNAILANLLVGVIVTIGFFLLIIPGIIFACKLAFTPYLVVDRKMDAIQAVKESWRMTGGYSWKVFLIGLLAIPISIAGFICLIVGIIPAGIWISLALASLYHAVSVSEAKSG